MQLDKVRPILENSFFQLLLIYLVYFSLIGLGMIKPLFKIDLFGGILGFFGCFLILKKKELKLSKNWVILSLLLVFMTRIVWYFYSSVPLGYDPGWYKFVTDFPFREQWTKGVFPMFFSLIMFPLGKVFGSSFLVKWLPVLLSLILCYVTYWFVSKEFGQTSGVIVSLLYTFSYTMYKVFWFNYIKNLLGMILLIVVIYLWIKNKRGTLILFAGMLAGIHRPAALIFGLSYLFYFIISLFKKKDKNTKEQFINGILIVLLMFIFNVDRITVFLLNLLPGIAKSVVITPIGGGTFFSLYSYWKFSFAYVPFAIIGIWFTRKRLKILLPFLISASIVLFRFIFYDRIIIYFDLFVLIYAAYGFNVLFNRYGKKTLIIFTMFLILTGVIFYSEIQKDSPLISEVEFDYIQSLNLPNSSILIITHSGYSTWIKGYYSGEVIAPGLFDNNPWNQTTWEGFWENSTIRSNLVSAFNFSNVFIHQGLVQPKLDWNNTCFRKFDEYLYKYIC